MNLSCKWDEKQTWEPEYVKDGNLSCWLLDHATNPAAKISFKLTYNVPHILKLLNCLVILHPTFITLIKSMAVFCETDSIPYNMWEIQRIFCRILSVPQNVVMDLNDVMLGR